jgi:hypothetical protein
VGLEEYDGREVFRVDGGWLCTVNGLERWNGLVRVVIDCAIFFFLL